MLIRWFFSRTVRQAVETRKHFLRLLRAQRDLLVPQAIDKVRESAQALQLALSSGADKAMLMEKMKGLEEAANKWLRPYPHASVRENIEVILVAVTVAMAIRTFFLQPMKIPTGSMQPTLYGITCENLKGKPGVEIPRGLKWFYEKAFLGTTYCHVVAKCDGTITSIDPPQVAYPWVNAVPLLKKLRIFNKQEFKLGNELHEVFGPPANLPSRPGVITDYLLFYHAGVEPGQVFRKGEDVIKLKVVAGDHLFVNRLIYNFRHPRRGDIVIFETTGIPDLQQDTYYIKRLVAIGGDRVQIGNDQHLIINGTRLDASTPNFEFVYTFDPEPKEYAFFGHVNEVVGERFKRPGTAPKFHDGNSVFNVRSNHFLVMGDNTLNSYDSRYWGDFRKEKVIGKSGFVYWPINSRFGWSHR
jgi:signal peptidase I